MTNNCLIQFENVSMIYKNNVQALKNVTFSIDEGEFVFITGHSGAGKTTMMNLLFCDEMPSDGKVIVGGKNTKSLSSKQIPQYRRQMGRVFQDFRLIQNLNVFDNVALSIRVVGASRKEIKSRVKFALDLVGLPDKETEMPNKLSGGEIQRVAIARAMANGPQILIADEPTGNIDPERSREIMKLFRRINKQQGTTIIVVTHEKHFVDEFHMRTLVLEDGVLVNDIPKSKRIKEEIINNEF